MNREGMLVLEDGYTVEGRVFGFPKAASGEVVFNTGMVGYPETLTDPSYQGQILVLTYPLIGNYGVPAVAQSNGLNHEFESDRIQVSGLIISNLALQYHHWKASRSLDQWLFEAGVVGIYGVDTRALTKYLRNHGSLLGKIVVDGADVGFSDPNKEDLVRQVTVAEPVLYGTGAPRIVLVDCGCKRSILTNLVNRGVTVLRVSYDYDFEGEDFDGVVISNGPGDPKMCDTTITHIRKLMQKQAPLLGICLGSQILALAAGGNTYKLKFGHRGQNQPCVEIGTDRCYVTSQNHGYAVDVESLPGAWEAWFVNANDGTNEGIRHRDLPFRGVQFHPEAAPGPVDTNFIFDDFLRMVHAS